MRPNVRAFLTACVDVLPLRGPVLEIGSFQVEGQAAAIDLRPLFPGMEYVGTDMRPGPGVDRVQDVMDLGFGDASFGTIVLADTLEHVEDPELAMREVRRVCAPDGLVLATSVMDFPIHGHPSDYWRFTPEAFRRLARSFATAAVFSGGPADHPHTVALAASPETAATDGLRRLADHLADLDTLQPPAHDSETRRLLHLLSRRLASPTRPQSHAAAGLDWPFDRPGWTLIDGSWVSGWLTVAPDGPLVVAAGETDVARVDPVQIDDARWTFRTQARVPDVDVVGPLTVSTGRLVHTSPEGVVVGTLRRHRGFRLEALDSQPADGDSAGEAARGAALVEQLRAAGKDVTVDLGCGFRKNGTVGIDITRTGTDADLVCRAGFEPLPLPSASVDGVFCRDFLEHVPKAVWRDGSLQYPIIDLMNEVWRILRPGGEFVSQTPGYPSPEVHQDPTHLSVWTENSFGYFTGAYPVARTYGVQCEFELVDLSWDRFYLCATLRRPPAGASQGAARSG